MKQVTSVEDAISRQNIPPGSRIYVSGNAATPQVLLQALSRNDNIRDVELLGVLLLGEIDSLFSEQCCDRVTHRVLFNSAYTRAAVNSGRAMYQLMHLSDVPRQLRGCLRPNVVLASVSGPDRGGNYSLGTTVEGVLAAIESAKASGGLVIAERNARMPFILGTTIPAEMIDFVLDTDYALPLNPSPQPDERARRIGRIIAELFIHDGCTLQYGIGEIPEAVTDAIIAKGVKDLGIHTELFATAMRKLVHAGVVTNKYSRRKFSISTVFLDETHEGYEWLDMNSSIQSRPCDLTNSILHIASESKMVAINSAIGVDLHGNIWADSLNANQIYSGIGGQSDFLRGAYLSEGGVPIIGLKSTTNSGTSKIVARSPEGVSVTAIAADPVVIVTEYGAFDPRGLSICEHAVGLAHLAEPQFRDDLLRHIYESDRFRKPRQALDDHRAKGFTAFEDL